MIIHSHRHSSRSVGSFLTALFAGAFAGLCWIQVLSRGYGPLGIMMAVFASAVLGYTVYFWLFPVVWSVELTGERLRWHSPHWPRQTREVVVADIAGAVATGEESGTVELRLISGETVRLQPTCVGREPQVLVRALAGLRPQ